MEQWQFLIQRQGERSWQPLESPYAEIVEGRYRIVASCISVNTDIEVRVIHQSPSEIPPRRRIHKRLRRTNSEGLTAVIPFTYFAPGVWEVRCSGDLMSDMLGASWQHNLRLQVLPLIATTEITPNKSNTEGNFVSALPTPPPPPNFSSQVEINELTLNDIPFEEDLAIQSANDEAEELETVNQELEAITPGNIDLDETAPVAENATTENIQSEININLDNLDADSLSNDSVSIENAISTENTSSNHLIEEQIEEQNLFDPDNTHNTNVIIDEPVSISVSSLALSIRNSEIEAIVDQPVSPVWVRGNNAEQILQNLIELALPNNDSLLEEETLDAAELVEQPLPLLLCLDEQSYIAQWGRSLTIRGRVKLASPPSLHQDDTSDFESVGACELHIDLRSPLGLEILEKQQQSIGERLLPFGFEFSVELPANCESKLILADIYLYGALSSVGDSILLASQSFTITADVTELLAVSATAKPSEPDMLDFAQPQLTPEPEKPSIDLELFNLAKTARGQVRSFVTQPSPKRALPLRVDTHKEKLAQTETSQSSNFESYSGLVSNVDSFTSLPFLRKRQVLVEEQAASNILVKEDIEQQENLELENLELEGLELEGLELENLVLESLKLETSSTTIDNVVAEVTQTTHVTTDNAAVNNQLHNFTEENLEPFRRSTFPYEGSVASNTPYVSPLIRKWMQRQGYSIPEAINLDYQNYPIGVTPENAPNLISTSSSTEEQVTELEIGSIEQGAEETQDVTLNEAVVTTEAVQEETQNIQTPPRWIEQEIVVDDIDEGVEYTQFELEETLVQEPTVSDMLSALPFSLDDIEVLPVPQINIPLKELVSGNTIRLRILLKEMRPHTGIKLWVEDCQTRWLLEGPHLLTDLQPNPFDSGMEVITELNIPFGCVEIRIETVAYDTITFLESDKASFQRTVIPPDLPALQFDELLGI
jgi:hypothetical protein